MVELFSVNEAAAIAEVSPETIRTALEKKSVTPSRKRRTGKAVRHQFSVGDVLFIKLLTEFPFPFEQAGQTFAGRGPGSGEPEGIALVQERR